ncbi:MAG: hypothetical protein E7158_02180 [Firmicutes bacterium]|nr:hypothetical protein [Bacillota bacterium]
MKKIVVFLFILTIVFLYFNKQDEMIIPAASIRYRIIANSNNLEDQALKLKIKNDINKEVMPILEKSSNIDESRQLIVNNLNKINSIVNRYTDEYKVTFGSNFFPEKTYKGINYESGNYESLVITIGSGLGENWWCVLYPPLCLIDDENTTDIEYTTLVSKILNNK